MQLGMSGTSTQSVDNGTAGSALRCVPSLTSQILFPNCLAKSQQFATVMKSLGFHRLDIVMLISGEGDKDSLDRC
ncbi:hypothetical protein N7517_009692 [Penicillium concentricum]|uniref:Uncharacterized protein n=1 Tax=Penicillium concentricum TaxID=293559 RepID=A0A9W9RI68_9EURO|nr:uncharacterized protein N7517_009692 [Penicillium concentricum]KAJ5360501.1 hypothetical protein N7517_009692 [Penicillium concentricum]